MSFKSLMKWVIPAIPFAILLAGIIIYVQVHTPPVGYAPVSLAAAQRDSVAEWFINDKLMDFHNKAQASEPFDWTLSQDQANCSLASADEISYRLGGAADTVAKSLQHARIEGLAIKFEQDQVTLMAKSLELDKVVSLPISFDYTGDGKLLVDLGSPRIGRMPIPQSLVQDQVSALQQAMPKNAAGRHKGSLKADDLAKLFATLLSAADGKPIEPELRWPRPVRVEKIEITPGQLKLRLRPLPNKE